MHSYVFVKQSEAQHKLNVCSKAIFAWLQLHLVTVVFFDIHSTFIVIDLKKMPLIVNSFDMIRYGMFTCAQNLITIQHNLVHGSKYQKSTEKKECVSQKKLTNLKSICVCICICICIMYLIVTLTFHTCPVSSLHNVVLCSDHNSLALDSQ